MSKTMRLRQWAGLAMYALVPLLLLCFLARPIGQAVRGSEGTVFPIFLAAMAGVGLIWLSYTVIYRKRPPLPLFAYGAFCLLAVTVMLYEGLSFYSDLKPILADIGGVLTLGFLLLLSFWFAKRPSRPAHAIAVGLRILYGLVLFAIAWQIFRHIEIRMLTRETWIYAGILIAGILAINGPRILAGIRRRARYRRANQKALGRIEQIIGETDLDLDGDPLTYISARVQYTVDHALYEIRADITRGMIRKFGRDAFVGQEIPVFYDPAEPAVAYANRIDRHFFDDTAEEEGTV